jgi:hypothetical protein
VPFQYAVPVLTAWDIGNYCDDIEIQRIGAWLEGMDYTKEANASTGTLTYRIKYAFHDDNPEALTKVRFKVKILGFNSMAKGPAPAIRAPLALYWHQGRADNASHATIEGEELAQASDYGFARIEGQVFATEHPGTVPLKSYWHAGRGDTATVATEQSQRELRSAGYVLIRTEGYVYPTMQGNTLPLRLFFHAGRGDFFTAATDQAQRDAFSAGYTAVRIEGAVFPPQ